MKASGSKAQYMCVNEREVSVTATLQGVEIIQADEFKYMELTPKHLRDNKRGEGESADRWSGWSEVSGVICDRRIAARMISCDVWFGTDKKKRQEGELEVTELKMLRFSLGRTNMDRTGNEYIRRTAQVWRKSYRSKVEMVWIYIEEG